MRTAPVDGVRSTLRNFRLGGLAERAKATPVLRTYYGDTKYQLGNWYTGQILKSLKTLIPRPGGWFNIPMLSYQCRNSYCGDKMILQPSYLHNGILYIDKKDIFIFRALGLSASGENDWNIKISLPRSLSYWWRLAITGISLGMRPANERCRYNATTSLIGWAHT